MFGANVVRTDQEEDVEMAVGDSHALRVAKKYVGNLNNMNRNYS